jgi:hypothetical protein
MKIHCLLIWILSFVYGFGQAGFFGSNAGGVILLSHNAGSDFATRNWNANLGSTHSLWLKGASAHTFKNNNGNICSATLHYRVYRQDAAPGSFLSFNLNFNSNHPFTTSTDMGQISSNNLGDQRWRDYNQNINIAALANSNGTWVLEVFFSATGSNSTGSGCTDSFFYSNNGNNYRIFFNIVDHFGVYASAVAIKTCQNTFVNHTYYHTSGNSTNQISTTNFNGYNFGAFFQNSGDFKLKGGELKTFKESYANICTPILHYRVYPANSSPTGSFQPININFFENCNGCTNGAFSYGDPCNSTGTCNDQKWQTLNNDINLTNYSVGNYILEIYFQIPGSNNNTVACDFARFVNNNGNNFKANFSIIPITTTITQTP